MKLKTLALWYDRMYSYQRTVDVNIMQIKDQRSNSAFNVSIVTIVILKLFAIVGVEFHLKSYS